MRRVEEVAWAAGLFEGEGSISHGEGCMFLVVLGNTDAEIVHRFDAAVDRGAIYGPYSYDYKDGYRRKPMWRSIARNDAAKYGVILPRAPD